MSQTFNVSFPPELAKDVDRQAKQERRSRSELLRAAALTYLQQRRRFEELSSFFQAEARRRGYKPQDVNRWIADYRREKLKTKGRT